MPEAIPRDEPKPETVLLLPAHGLDDLPEALPAADAAGLLNAFALAWHPALLASARALPQHKRADQPPRPAPHRRFLVAECVLGKLPDGWLDGGRKCRGDRAGPVGGAAGGGAICR